LKKLLPGKHNFVGRNLHHLSTFFYSTEELFSGNTISHHQ
jgi:hypothetical protein